MIRNPYIGIDMSEKSIDYCKRNFEGEFHHVDAEKYIKQVDSINPVFLFSFEYISPEIIKEYLEKTEDVFIAIRLNRPYDSQTSVYSGQKETYYELHPEEELEEYERLMEEYNATTFRLLDEDYYYVSIIRREE